MEETAFTPAEAGYRDAPEKGGSITITRKWFAPHFIFFAFFCVIWNGFLYVWYSNLGSAPGAVSVLAAIFPLAHVAAGIGLTYFTICGFFNHTTFRLDATSLTVRHAPLPWKGNRTIAREDIKQMYCERSVTQGKGGPNTSFYLAVVLMDERKVRLGMMDQEQAKYIEDVLEEHLGINDMAVPGEA